MKSKKMDQIINAECDNIKIEKYGGKAYWLSWLIKHGFNIPLTLLIPINFNYSKINRSLFDELLLRTFGNTDKTVNSFILRSSGTKEDGSIKSFAGYYNSIIGLENFGDIINNLPRINKLNKENTNDSIGVIIQKYINASVSGVIFSSNPINYSKNEMVINYIAGNSGELLAGRTVGRQIIYKVDMENIGLDDELLEKTLLNELIYVAKKIEGILTYPVDVEWCVDSITGELYIVQCRPMTNNNFKKNQLFVLSNLNKKYIPKGLQNNEKIQLRLRCNKVNIKTSNAYLLLLNQNNNYDLKEIAKNKFTKIDSTIMGYSLVLIQPPLIKGKVIRVFSNASIEHLLSGLTKIIKVCKDKYWRLAILIHELAPIGYVGLLKKLKSVYLVELSFGGFTQKGITEIAKYKLNENGCVIEYNEPIQSFKYDIVNGVIEKTLINKRISIDHKIFKIIVETFNPIISNDSITVEFGLNLNAYDPYLIDIQEDRVNLDINEIDEGIISKGIIKGIIENIKLRNDTDESVNKHYYNELKVKKKYPNCNTIIIVDKPDIALLDILSCYESNKVGFIFQEASILSHFCIVLRENNIPAIIANNINYQNGEKVIIDTYSKIKAQICDE